MDLTTTQKQMFNQMRLYMKMISAADLLDETTGMLKSNIIGCQEPNKSSFGFPYIKKFPKSWIVLWDSIIMSIIFPRLQSLPLSPRVSQSHLDVPLNIPTKTKAYTTTSIKLDQKDIALISPHFHMAVQHIKRTIQSSPRWKRHIWGKSTFNHRSLYNILQSAMNKRLAIATDASVNQGDAVHGFCFADRRKGTIFFTSGSKVEGPARHLTSYRAEMTSIIAGTELIDTILSAVGLQASYIPLYTDSETSIMTSKNNRMNTLHYVLSNDIDVVLQLKETLDKCGQNVKLIHITGHQDKTKKFHELEIPARLNVLMDGLSKKMVEDTKNDPNKIIPFPAQALFLYTDRPLAHDIQEVLIKREMKKEVDEYYEKHHNIPRQILPEIDWDANRLGISARHELSYRKTFHQFRNTMSINHKWGRFDSDLCPLCSKKPETVSHLLVCDQRDIRNLRHTLLSKMVDQWNKLNTQKDLVHHWKNVFYNMEQETNIPLPKLTMDPITWKIIQAHQHQSKIGWTSFTNGMLSNKWSAIQQSRYDSDPKDGENIFRWKRSIIRSFMDLLRELWILRCGFINVERVLTEKDMLSKRTLTLYEKNHHLKDMLPTLDRHLLDKKETYFRTSSKETLEIWEDRVKKALRMINVREDNQ